jgi:hypothetical protein
MIMLLAGTAASSINTTAIPSMQALAFVEGLCDRLQYTSSVVAFLTPWANPAYKTHPSLLGLQTPATW